MGRNKRRHKHLPHDLRRRRLTDLARERGIEYAQSVAVHTDPRMTQSYVAGVARVAL